MLAAIAALTITAAIGAGLVIFASPHVSAPTAAFRVPAPSAAVRLIVPPPSPTKVSFEQQRAGAVWVQVQPNGVTVTLPQPHGLGVEIHTIGSILLIVGIAGVILSLLFLFWWSSSRRFDTARP